MTNWAGGAEEELRDREQAKFKLDFETVSAESGAKLEWWKARVMWLK